MKASLSNFLNFPAYGTDNAFDFGLFLPGLPGHITLVSWSARPSWEEVPRLSSVNIHPMLMNLGGGYGWVNAKISNNKLKVYSHLTHLLKCYSSQMSTKMAANNRALRRHETGLFNIRHFLRDNQGKMSGIRVEIRLGGDSLHECTRKAARHRIWVMEDLQRLGFEFRHIPTQDYINMLHTALSSANCAGSLLWPKH
ncbi:hypothetical protein BC829DRAFT_444338 [Chytridium lagenaria]|nr:hypothetical protein BC829DRAFT_444338 [Chytridium lagenaria]